MSSIRILSNQPHKYFLKMKLSCHINFKTLKNTFTCPVLLDFKVSIKTLFCEGLYFFLGMLVAIRAVPIQDYLK